MPPPSDKIYSATYSNVPVYEYNVNGNHIMRRRSDDWINATHILKVADYDKPARTRILEREVQKGVHEKVQGGYGKYQGTWIPLQDGRELAAKNGVLEKLRPIFDFVPGDRTPPPAPKHATAASNKPRAPRAPAQPRRQPGKEEMEPPARAGTKRSAVYANVPDYDQMDVHDDGTPDNVTTVSDAFDDFDQAQYTGGSRKRRRVEDQLSPADKEHRLWADELLDYFMLADNSMDALPNAPVPPATIDLNRPIDEKGHTALHWASAMGDIEVVKDLIRRGAAIDVPSKSGETPLMRAVLFTNNYDKQNMEKLAGLLIRTVNMQEWYGSSVFHHIAGITQRKSKYACARYYMDCILVKMSDLLNPDQIERILNMQDQNGDTAITIAARNGARKCVRSLIGRNAAVDIPNNVGETADQLIVQLNRRRQERHNQRQLSSSPFQGDHADGGMMPGGPVQSHMAGLGDMNGGIMLDPLLAQSAMNGGLQSSLESTSSSVYKSEHALAITSAIVPAIFDKTKSLANTLEAEISEKELEQGEAERVASTRAQELELLKRQMDELRTKEMEQLDGTEGDDQLLAELDALMKECEELTRAEDDAELKDMLNREEQKHTGPADEDLMMDDENDDQVKHKLALVRELHTLVEQRRNLFKTIVQNLSVAGLGDKQAEYKRLITGALGVREEDVEDMLPEIVGELEWHADADGGLA
ncbi:hypothetical protein AC578_8260 [Pseudocercospora eumusae]|uniref:HTH APSES-type domain-containing protein n=1 Tax=Pseudocercospora eumusae TaxID=321146 RepID=A0A139HE24_9PEZI|nr:hypothetical protein AC578_8260 [Pseudocercospora eumusae]